MELQNTVTRKKESVFSIPDRLPSLDGWRAVSIFFVLLQHSASMPGWPKFLNFGLLHSIGGVGVRFFFVISGFLITWLLIKEGKKYGNVSIKSFFVRRCIRIFPVLYTYLIAVGLLHYFGKITVTPVHYLIAGTFMCDIFKGGVAFAHLWSLGVEEKFYLFWPVLFVLSFQKGFKKLINILLILLIAGPILRLLVSVYSLDNVPIFNSHSFITIYDGLAIGCLGAILLSEFTIAIGNFYKKHNYLLFIASAILIVLPATFWQINLLKGLQPLQDTLQCSGFLIVMLQSILNPGFFVYKVLNLKFVQHIGVISYSLYIWMGIAELHNGHGIPIHFLNMFPGWLLLVFLLAELSYNLIENPILKMKKPILVWLGLNR